MPFIGKQPEVGAYQLIDSITTSATATYALTVDGSAYFPASARNLIVSLNGVTQAPESAYTVSGSNIVFDSALTASDVIDYIMVIGDAVDIGTPSDGTVGTSQMSYPLGNFSSTGIDDNATSTAITIDSSQNVSLSNDLTVDTNTLVVDSTNNRVGIGTTSPDSALHVVGAINGTVSSHGVRIGSDADYARLELANTQGGFIDFGSADGTDFNGRIIYRHSTDVLDFYTAKSLNMTLDSSGNLGIGANTFNSKLNVVGKIEALNTSATDRADITVGAHDFYSTPSYAGVLSTYNGASSTGTTYGITNANLGTLRFQNTSHGLIGTNGSAPLIFATLSAERMRIDSSGRLMLNITASSIQAPLRGQAFGTTSSYFGYYFDAAGTVLSYVRADGLFSTGNGSLSPYSFSTTGRDVYVNSNGQLGYVSSIREAKENIQPLESVGWLYSLSPVSFNYKQKDDEGVFTTEINDEVEYGLIADEVEQVNPNLCFYDEDEEGNQTLAGVSYRKLIPVLTKAIQEQQTIIEDLQTRLSALEAN